MSHIYLHGVRIDNLTMERALSLACERAGEPCWVVTPNALMLDACRKHPAYAELLNRASLSLPDGAGVLLAARHAKRGNLLPSYREREQQDTWFS